MLKTSKKLTLRTETIRALARTLSDHQLQKARGGEESGITSCMVCEPSDSPQHCATYTRSGQQSCDLPQCTYVTL